LPTEPNSSPRLTILLVDDNADFRIIFQRKFTDLGYEVLTAPDGVRGLQLVLNASPDLVLLDMSMPHRGGLETLRLIRSVQPQAKVILLTGYIEDDARLEAQELGVSDVILKPVSIKDLAQSIEAVLHEPAATSGM
jgi:CheY-like chemotaxis protein